MSNRPGASDLNRTKKITTVGVLSALAFVSTVFGRVPVMVIPPFLKYDPKDIIITIGGFIYGPLTALAMSVVVSFVEMFTISENGFFGLLMNVIASCAFACVAAVIYKRWRTMTGAVVGLVVACMTMTASMLLWDYLVAPYYMHVTREQVAGMLVPVFLPFNLLKSGINAAGTMLLYKPAVRGLRKAGVLSAGGSGTKSKMAKGGVHLGILLASLFVLASCILLVLVWQGKL